MLKCRSRVRRSGHRRLLMTKLAWKSRASKWNFRKSQKSYMMRSRMKMIIWIPIIPLTWAQRPQAPPGSSQSARDMQSEIFTRDRLFRRATRVTSICTCRIRRRRRIKTRWFFRIWRIINRPTILVVTQIRKSYSHVDRCRRQILLDKLAKWAGISGPFSPVRSRPIYRRSCPMMSYQITGNWIRRAASRCSRITKISNRGTIPTCPSKRIH